MRENIVAAIEKILVQRGFETPNVFVEHPADFSHGEYSSNVALQYGKQLGIQPQELALTIKEELEKGLPRYITKVEIAGPGFLNFYASREFFTKSVSDIVSAKNEWGRNKMRKGEKVMVEYTDPNPFKEFHIGHLMSNAVGEAISRLIEFSSAEVVRANYQGDVGPHVAKAIFGKMKKPELSWGEAYAFGATQYEADEVSKKEITLLNKKIYEKSDAEVNELYAVGRKSSLETFEELYKKLGTHFDYYFFESAVAAEGVSLVKKNIGTIFEKGDEGAVIYRGEKVGLHTRVFLNKEGLPTYEAKELGLFKAKKEAYPFDQSISITAEEQREYFRVVLSAMKELFGRNAEKVVHKTHGMMMLPTGKMSSRTGDVVTAEGLISDVEEKIRQKTQERGIQDAALDSAIAIGALKYLVLKQATGKNIVYDVDKALSFEGDSGPYIQYAHTRAEAVLARKGFAFHIKKKIPDTVTELEHLLYRFPEVVCHAQSEYEPHYVVTYLTQIASAFNSFYAQEKIIGNMYEAYYLDLTKAFAITMKNGLWLLGVQAPQKM